MELKPRIKPRKRLVRDKPEPLSVPLAFNEVWSMDFMQTSSKMAGTSDCST